MTPGHEPGELPLRPHVFHILLALADSDRHGLGIADEVERTSEGLLELGPGTLYRTLAELASAGLISAVEAPDEKTDPRRKYYRINARGRLVLAAEVERLKRLVGAAARRVLPDLA
jgi:DNA-binding PadR family transcriptional regulator